MLVHLNANETREGKTIGNISHRFSGEISVPALPVEGMTLEIRDSVNTIYAVVKEVSGLISSPNRVCKYIAECTFEAESNGDEETDGEERYSATNFAVDDFRTLLNLGFVEDGRAHFTKSNQTGPVIYGEDIEFTI